MEKSERPKASRREDGIDLISNMPDHILLLILSRLKSTEEVIRSSILSRRWRYLWTSIPSLYIRCFRKGMHFKKNKFKEFVYRVLVNKSVDLDRLHLFCSNYYSMSTVGMWIYAAVRRNVKELNLTFSPKDNTKDIELPHCLVACGSLKVLRLSLGYNVLRLLNVTGFPTLKVLSLTCVDFLEDNNLVKDFFQSCPLLEDLRLDDCVLNKLGLLCISCPKLKKLTIGNCYDDEEDMCGGIKICCPKLVFLALKGHIAYKFFFECLDSLKEAEIEPKLMDNTISVFSGISQVESLLIDVNFFTQCINTAFDPSLPNLKTLVLSTTIGAFTMEEFNRILKYYPKLESLKLIVIEELWREEQEVHEGDPRSIFTNDVKRVEIFELNGEKPKLVIDLEEKVLLEIVFSWGKKFKYSH
ncbi:FBD-associated F-box protein At5g56370 isoform X1 [Lactuca sativa]|uniref:FBD-associated F-box protein At5g56370 isoform X1 n=1 Tax=Lactuca sativa TaxID=4236 RepID=UPI001C68C618|nr:FBD-associated F-box protein At5g56370 isoform X1 [Lactuca sativa]